MDLLWLLLWGVSPFVNMTYDGFRQVILEGCSIPYTYTIPPVWTDEYISWNEQSRSKKPCPNRWITVNPGVCSGRLIGGNLNTMEGFFGTEYMPEIQEGDILLPPRFSEGACTMSDPFPY